MLRRPPRVLLRTAGQASLDYVAILALAGVALLAGSGVAMARGGDLASAVRSQMARALCVVTAGDCERDLAPCVTASRSEKHSVGVTVLLVRLDKERAVIVDERSDGTFEVTLVGSGDSYTVGLDLGVGVGGSIALGGRTLAVGAELRAAALAREGHAKTWFVRSAAEKDALVRKLARKTVGVLPERIDGADLPEPDMTTYEHGTDVSLDTSGSVGPGSGAFGLGATDLDGARKDLRTGNEIVYMKRSDALSGMLSGAGASAKGGKDDATAWSYEQTPDGRLVDLMILQSGEYRGSFSLPPIASRAAGYLGVPSKHARRYETEIHLDLTEPENLRAAQGFVDAVRGSRRFEGALQLASDALRRRIDAHATVHTRVYGLDTTTKGGELFGGIGAKVRGKAQQEIHTAKLLAATTRGPDGSWQLRTDCEVT